MKLTETTIIKKKDLRYKSLDNLCTCTKNLYNAALQRINDYYRKTGQYLNYYNLIHQFVNENQKDYRSMPAKVSQQVLRMLNWNYKSFFELKKSNNNTNKKISTPHYLNKNDRYTAVFVNQAISNKRFKYKELKLSGLDCIFKTKVDPTSINQVLIIPRKGYYKIDIIYTIPDPVKLKDNKRYAAIDLGVNNLAAVASNVIKPFIINGKPLKSINQFYNKKRAQLNSECQKIYSKKAKDKIISLTNTRNNKIKTYLHKASRFIVNQLVTNNIHTLIIGKNTQWKININIGKRNNQNFWFIPYNLFISQLKYKCALEGIEVKIIEESYTSKCSFLDNEKICKHADGKYMGKRIKRGLFKTATGKLINADLNGALNILRKVIGEFQYPIEVCSTPRVETMFDTRKLNA